MVEGRMVWWLMVGGWWLVVAVAVALDFTLDFTDYHLLIN